MAYQVDRLYSYTVAHDGGFAPNPFWGMCTLACCKPKIRKSVGERLKAHPEEKIWVVGLSSKHRDKGNDIIFIMQVNCAMNFADYWRKHPEKRPVYAQGKAKERRGDNIYRPDRHAPSGFSQLRSAHSLNPKDDVTWKENPESIEHDLAGEYVLLSDGFVYYGSSPLPLPFELRELVVGRSHRCNFTSEFRSRFSRFLEEHRSEIDSKTVAAMPHLWSGREKPKCR